MTRTRCSMGLIGSLGFAGLVVGILTASSACAQTTRIGDLTVRAGDVPRRLVGYGLVVGLDGTGDRSYGGSTNQTPTVQSIVNLLEHFGVRVPYQSIPDFVNNGTDQINARGGKQVSQLT